MTMTDTEAKALALVNEIEVERYSVKRMPEIRRKAYTLDEALCRAIEREAATEARHAAELREQAERFDAFRQEVSDAVEGFWNYCRTTNTPFPADLESFIIPAPDPLVEVLHGIFFNYAPENAQADADALRAAIEARGGKIVWGEGQ